MPAAHAAPEYTPSDRATSAARRHLVPLGGVLILAALGRAALLLSGSVSFHADEAVIALMARHILEGARPVFFYGQAYMGSLDAWLVAGGFAVLGESVLTIRLVQSVLYLAIVGTGYWVGWQLSGRRTIALVTGLVLAVPPVVVALYTTATLGGYNETLLLGNVIVILGYAVTHGHADSRWRWAVLGGCAGLGFWANALLVVTALPVALLILRYFSVRRLPLYALAVFGFVVCSAPWWVFDFTHDHAALETFLRHEQTGEFAGIGIPYVPPAQRILGMAVLGWPALFGLRFPWSGAYILPPAGLLVGLIYTAAAIVLLRRHNPLKSDARALVLGTPALFVIIFIASHFGADPTGRYFLPMIIPLAVLLGTLAETLRVQGRVRAAVAVVALVIGTYGAGQVLAARQPPGLTTQFDPVSHITNDHDDALIEWLDAHEIRHGYTSYWIAFRLAFLSEERLQFSAALPYKQDLSYNPADNRYSPYAEATAQAERVAYITTTHLPELQQRLVEQLAALGVRYRLHTLGPYVVFYDLSVPVRPAALDLYTNGNDTGS